MDRQICLLMYEVNAIRKTLLGKAFAQEISCKLQNRSFIPAFKKKNQLLVSVLT